MSYISKSYEELITINGYIERMKYLQCHSNIGDMTFGGNRFINQQFYTSYEWKKFREKIILRDMACDMALDGYEISHNILIHHINPITIDDIVKMDKKVMDPNNVVCVSHQTHNAIHYANELSTDPYQIVTRKPNDTCPWRR